MAQECVQLGDVGCGVFGVPLHADNGGIDRLDGLDRSVGNPARVIKALDPSMPRAIEAASVGVISLGETGERA